MSVRTPRAPRAGTEGTSTGAAGPARTSALDSIHEIVLPTPWDVGEVHVYLVREDPLTLVDAGLKTAESRAALELAFDRLGVCLEDIQRVVVTHHHRDHLGQVHTLRDVAPDLEVWAHADEVRSIEKYAVELQDSVADADLLLWEYGVPPDVLEAHNRARRQELGRLGTLCDPTPVDRVLHAGDRVPFADFDLEVLHAPGHTAGHLLLYEERSGALLTGDHILPNSVPFTTTYHTDAQPDPDDPARRRPRFKGLPAYMRSVRALRPYRVSRVLPAHGGAIGRPDRLIEDSILFYDVRVQRIERGLRKLAAMGQDVTAWEIWQALLPGSDPVSDLRPSMFMVIGALDVLEEMGACRAERRDDGILVHHHS